MSIRVKHQCQSENNKIGLLTSCYQCCGVFEIYIKSFKKKKKNQRLRRWLLRVHNIDASSLRNQARNARFGHQHPARLTPHSAVTPCGDESLNIFKIFFSPRTDLRLSRPIEIVIEKVSTCFMGLYNEVARACGDQSTKSETSQ